MRCWSQNTKCVSVSVSVLVSVVTVRADSSQDPECEGKRCPVCAIAGPHSPTPKDHACLAFYGTFLYNFITYFCILPQISKTLHAAPLVKYSDPPISASQVHGLQAGSSTPNLV